VTLLIARFLHGHFSLAPNILLSTFFTKTGKLNQVSLLIYTRGAVRVSVY
jgi:hypothetical protein